MENMFIDDEKEIKQSKKTVHSSSNTENADKFSMKETKIPKEYIPIKLSSLGKLDAPKILHVRNYTGQDALDLSITAEEDLLNTIVHILQNMIYEDIDPTTLHQKELEEILMNIFFNYWSNSLVYPYPYTESELEEIKEQFPEKYNNIKNNSINLDIELKVHDLVTEPISEDFKEPVVITIDKEVVRFWLPRIGHILNAKKYIEDKYANEKNKFSKIEQDLLFNEKVVQSNTAQSLRSIDTELQAQYKDYQHRRTLDFLKVNQAQLIVSHNNKETKTLEEQLEAYEHISLKFWRVYNNAIDTQLFFGLKNLLKVTSPLTNKEIERRFQFRLLDFIPTMESEIPTEHTITFGD